MKFIKWKTFFITNIVCLLPIILGLILWDKLPESMAVHFDVNNNPDNYATKSFAVFVIPLLMVIVQSFCCFVNDINSYKHGERKKFEIITKWIIPVMTIVLQIATFCYNLGYIFEVRKVAGIVVGLIFIAIGNYLPKFDYIKNYDTETYKARKCNRFIGFMSVIIGILFIISIFLPSIYTLLCILLLIPYTIISIIYVVYVIKH